jgi:hypothetical protein
LPYKQKQSLVNGRQQLANLSFNLLLPKKRFGLDEALDQMNGTDLIRMLNTMETRDFVVSWEI